MAVVASPLALLFAAAERRLVARLDTLAARLDAGDDAAWPDFLATVTALRALVPEERMPLLKTEEMAERLGVSPKTVRKLGKRGRLVAEHFGKRGTGAIRWRA